MVLARKHDGTYRMCIEYCKLNQFTMEDSIPLPQMDDVLGVSFVYKLTITQYNSLS